MGIDGRVYAFARFRSEYAESVQASDSQTESHGRKRPGSAGHDDHRSGQKRSRGEVMKRLAIPLAALLSISAFAQETKTQREGAISGRVVADDGQPMSGAQVIAVSVGKSRITGGTQATNCDADGNFKVTG